MATPRADSYVAASGAWIAAGRRAWPAWRRAMLPRTWALVPQVAPMSALDPTLDPAHWQPGVSDFGGRGLGAAFSWVSPQDYDGKLLYPLTGGHDDYGGNEPYELDLMQDAPAWRMVRPPTGSKLATVNPSTGLPGYPVVTRDNQTAIGIYADGRLRAAHTYNNQCYVPAVGGRAACVIVARINACYPNPSATQLHKSFRYDLATGESTLFADYSSLAASLPGNGVSSNDGVAVYDPVRDIVWHAGHGTNRMLKLNMATGVTTLSAATAFASGDTLVYIPGLDVLYAAKTNQFFDLATETFITPSVTGSFSAGLRFATFPMIGASWVPSLGCVCLWNNTSAVGEISTLTPTGSKSQPWVRGVLANNPLNTVLPTASFTNDDGIGGRFRLIAPLEGFVHHLTPVGGTYFYAL